MIPSKLSICGSAAVATTLLAGAVGHYSNWGETNSAGGESPSALQDLRNAVSAVARPHKQRPDRKRRDPDPDRTIAQHAIESFQKGRQAFRHSTFGNEAFWGDTLQLHKAILGESLGGIGPGVSPATALAVGLKVDVEALPRQLQRALARGDVDLDDPGSTIALLKADAVVGIKGEFDEVEQLTSLGISCALCHSSVDDSFAPGIGRRLDGWANRDLNVGAIINLSPDLSSIASLLSVDEDTVRFVLDSWGPGKFDAGLLIDGKAFRPDGESAATVIPAAFGLAGVNLATYTGWGSVTHWNAFVANLEMQGQGTFYDPRLNNLQDFPIAAVTGAYNVRSDPDLVTSELADLHFYQLAIPAPEPPPHSFDQNAAERGKEIFENKASCATCHVPPLYTEPGWNMHTPEEIGIDGFQANRSPDKHYRTTPLTGLFTKSKGGYYHDGRFADLGDVVEHYDNHFSLNLTVKEKTDLVEFLKSL